MPIHDFHTRGTRRPLDAEEGSASKRVRVNESLSSANARSFSYAKPSFPTKFLDLALGVTAREEKGMEDKSMKSINERLISAEKQVENTLVRNHAQEIATITQASGFRYARHNLLSLRAPVVALADDSALAKDYDSKGPLGRIMHVREEARLERRRLILHAQYALKRAINLDKELERLEEENDLMATVRAGVLKQLQKNREKERLIKEKRAAADAATDVTTWKLSRLRPRKTMAR